MKVASGVYPDMTNMAGEDDTEWTSFAYLKRIIEADDTYVGTHPFWLGEKSSVAQKIY